MQLTQCGKYRFQVTNLKGARLLSVTILFNPLLFKHWSASPSFDWFLSSRSLQLDFLGGSVASAGDMGLISSREDSTCDGATEPVGHNYWVHALEPMNSNYWSPCSSLCSATRETTAVRSPHTSTKSSSPACYNSRKPMCSLPSHK